MDTGAHRDGGGGGGEGQRRLGVSLSLCSHIVLDEAFASGTECLQRAVQLGPLLVRPLSSPRCSLLC